MTPPSQPTFWLPRPGEPERIEHRTCRERTEEEEQAVFEGQLMRAMQDAGAVLVLLS